MFKKTVILASAIIISGCAQLNSGIQSTASEAVLSREAAHQAALALVTQTLRMADDWRRLFGTPAQENIPLIRSMPTE